MFQFSLTIKIEQVLALRSSSILLSQSGMFELYVKQGRSICGRLLLD